MSEHIACGHAREGLTEYLEDALPSERRQGIETHLASCGRCQQLYDRFRHEAAVISRPPREAMPAKMKQALLRAFRDRRIE